MEIKKFIEENESRFLDELFSLIRIPSISSQKVINKTCWHAPNAGANC